MSPSRNQRDPSEAFGHPQGEDLPAAETKVSAVSQGRIFQQWELGFEGDVHLFFLILQLNVIWNSHEQQPLVLFVLQRRNTTASPLVAHAFPPPGHKGGRMSRAIFTHSAGYKQLLRSVQSAGDTMSHGWTAWPWSSKAPWLGHPSDANHVYSQGQPVSTTGESQTQYEVPMFLQLKDLLFPQFWSLPLEMLSKQGCAGKGLFQEVTGRTWGHLCTARRAVTRTPQSLLHAGTSCSRRKQPAPFRS